jgi:hypothetical protein
MTFPLASMAARPAAAMMTTLVLVLPAFAQEPAAAAAPPSAPVTIAPMTCTKPSDFMPTFQSKQELTRFQKALDVYRSCVMDYAHVNATKANELAAQARAYNDTANDAITKINAYLTELNEASANSDKAPAMTQGGPKINQ